MNDILETALNRLAKWRRVFAWWQLGDTAQDDPEAAAVRDRNEVLLFLRAESSAMGMLLIRKGIITKDEWEDQLIIEAKALEEMLEDKFPGLKATTNGISVHGEAGSNTIERLLRLPNGAIEAAQQATTEGPSQ